MARKGNRRAKGYTRRSAVTRRVQREASRFSRFSDLLDRYETKRLYDPDPLQDRRLFHPERDWSIYDLEGKPATYKLSHPQRPARFYDPTTARIGFSHPLRIKECLKRKMRREVLFAKRKTGKGSGSPRRLTLLSSIKC